MILSPALINPLRWINTSDFNKSFDGDFALNQLNWYQSKKCYFQPWQNSDRLKLQIIADAPPPSLDILDCFTNQKIASVTFSSVPTIFFKDFPTYVVYEINYSFTGIAQGRYYASLGIYTSEPFEVADKHLNTTLIKYKHSDNDFDVVFDTGIEFEIRVESDVSYEAPKSNRDVYYDQPNIPTQLNSLTFRSFKLYLGYGFGLPQWMIDKIAHCIACDTVTYNNITYQVAAEAEFEVDKNFDNNWMGGSIEIQPVNSTIKYITTGVVPLNSFKPMQKSEELTNISGNRTVSGVFKANSNLEKIIIYKTGVNYRIKIGTTVNGNEIGEFDVDDNTGVVKTVEWTFTGTSNVYLSGTGLNADFLYLIYKQLDAPDISLDSNGTTNATDLLKKGAKMQWDGTNAEFIANWDQVTGLGKPNTGWQKWCIAGTNGTTNVDGKVHVGIKVTGTPDYSTLGNAVGSNTKTITKENLPASGLNMFASNVGAVGGNTPGSTDTIARARLVAQQTLNYEIVKGDGAATLGVTSNMGSGTPLDITPASVISLFIVKIVD